MRNKMPDVSILQYRYIPCHPVACSSPTAARNNASKRPAEPLYYGDYLQLDKLLSAQSPKSREAGDEAHEEMLFITTHRECWSPWASLL